MAYFKHIRCIEEIAWLKFHFNKNKRKLSFMKNIVLNDNI
jgi:hypothetical protein